MHSIENILVLKIEAKVIHKKFHIKFEGKKVENYKVTFTIQLTLFVLFAFIQIYTFLLLRS